MNHIPRRISKLDVKGEAVECSDAEFFDIDANLILLGEPGAGKTELLDFAHRKIPSEFYNACTLESFHELDGQTRLIIIDGVDEVTAYETGTPVNKILQKLPGTTRFILSCRAADWQGTVNTNIISQKWKKEPIVGHILPLNEKEIIQFVTANGEGQDGDDFLREALQRDAVDLLRNPQNLLLMLQAVKHKGWPATRLELYETASLELVKEGNKFHNSISKSQPSIDQLIEAAGFVFSQLLLSGKAGVQIDGEKDGEYPQVSELVSDDISNEIIRSALSTKLFRQKGQNLLEPCHRTVAEYLAAKWLTNALGNQLSAAPLKSILYGSDYFLPAALRGLHAWIATLNSAVAEAFIKRDPYGFFRYGDPSILTVSQSKTLLRSLEELAKNDPYFRNEDWHATFGRGLARKELRDHIVRVIRTTQTPYQLRHLIIESIQGDKFANEISSDLLSIVFASTATYVVRHAAVGVLSKCDKKTDWQSVVKNLRILEDRESLDIALDIVKNHVGLFTGITLAELLILRTRATASDSVLNNIGLWYRIRQNLSIIQLEESMDIFAGATIETEAQSVVDDWLFKFVEERFKRDPLPSASRVCSWLKNSKSHSHHRSDWDKYSREYFCQDIKFRQELQVEALKSAVDAQGFFGDLCHLGNISAGLLLREEDFILHLKNLLKDKSSYSDWDERWRILVQFGKNSFACKETFLDFVRDQARQNNILSSHLVELEKQPQRDYEKELKERERQWKQEMQHETLTRHQSFQKIQHELVAGKRLLALHHVANAYLGRLFNDTTSPTDRVSQLVGDNMTAIAFKGIVAAMTRDDIPTAKQIVELHANEQEKFFFEPILLAHCAIMLQSKGHLTGLPIDIARSALASCHWDVSFGDDLTSDLQERLEQIVFAARADKETFVRDTMEPYLNRGAEHVSGLYRLARKGEFSDIAGPLAVEWIENYTNLSNNSLRELLFAAIRHGSEDKVVALIRDHVFSKELKNEERHLWMAAIFLLDFDNNVQLLTKYAEEDKKGLWALRVMTNPAGEIYEGWPKLSAKQNHFLITKFGVVWPPAIHPTGVTSGDQNPWNASQFVQRKINDLAADISDEAKKMLESLIDLKDLKYQNHIKHLHTQRAQSRAEDNKAVLSIREVKKILLAGGHANKDDGNIFAFNPNINGVGFNGGPLSRKLKTWRVDMVSWARQITRKKSKK